MKEIIGYLGPEGSFSHEAAIILQKKMRDKAKLKAYSSYSLAEALFENKVQKAVLPIENSLDGQVNWVIDLLASDFTFFIEQEIVLTIVQNLLGFGKISDIKIIYSHPSALGQCRQFLKKLDVQIKDVDSTSEAVKIVAKTKNLEVAAIGTLLASKIYQVPVIKKAVNDKFNNQTRFIVLGKEKRRRNQKNKTSLIFLIPDKPGALVRVLEIFDVLDINMKTLFSRPLKTKLGEYMFFVDIEGHQNERKVSVALETLKKKVKLLKILGSYPVSVSEI